MLKEKENLKNKEILNPFSHPLCSLSGFVFKLFKLFFLNKENVYAINHEYGKSSHNTSIIENEWASVMEFLFPEKEFKSEFNNENGQKVFKEAIPDLYSEKTKQSYFFQGCRIHAHLDPNCIFNSKCNENTLNPFGKTFKEVNDSFLKQMESLLINNKEEINEIIIEWQCNYMKKRETPIIKSFLNLDFKPHIGYRLKPRCAVRGGYSDVYGLFWNKTSFPKEKFVFLDTTGLYSYVSIKFPFMTGKLKIVMGQDLNKIQITNNNFFYENKRILGAILLTIVPNRSLYLPFLMYRRNKDQKSFNTLCKICCENETTVCNHSDSQRAITSTYMITEIEYALSLGYKIVKIHEMHIYLNFDYILKPFVQTLNFLKTKNSNCFAQCKGINERKEYCAKLNTKMNLQTPLLLTPKNIKHNALKRNFYKLCCNSIFGKLEERHDKSQIVYASTSTEIANLYCSEKIIDDFYVINDKLCELHLKPNLNKLKPNRKSNCYLGAQVTAYARQTIHEQALKIVKLNYKLFHINCDSIMFSLPVSDKIPLEISHALGDFKHEIENEIISFYSLGNKSYSISYKTKENVIKTTSKICGLSITGKRNEIDLNEKIIKLKLNKFFFQLNQSLKIDQKRFKRDWKKKLFLQKFNIIHLQTTFQLEELWNIITFILILFRMVFIKINKCTETHNIIFICSEI